jgi:GntR family transcriptional regulator
VSRPRAYRLIANELRQRVLAGTSPPGSRMPSLREVQEEFGVSQAVARSAYQVLIGEGLVEGRFGGGYYVRTYRPIIRHGIQRLAQDPRTAGLSIWDTDPGTAGRELVVADIQVTTEGAPDDVAHDLGLDADARTVVRRRRYILDGKPVLLSTSYFPADIAAGTLIEHVDTGPGGVYAWLTDAGQPPAWFQEDVTSHMPTPEERDQLKLPPGSPALVIRRTVWGPTGRGLEVNAMVADAGTYVLRYQWRATEPEGNSGLTGKLWRLPEYTQAGSKLRSL